MASAENNPATEATDNSAPYSPKQQTVAHGTGLFSSREACVYTKCYCEENVWKLCHKIQNSSPGHLDKCYAVFISNSRQAVPIWHQRACSSPESPVVWDYHVIFLFQGEKQSDIYDLDTQLAFPVRFDVYMAHSMRLDEAIKPEYHRMFRVIPAQVYLEKFSCDRSHMRKEDQTWMSPPPEYPCIQLEGIATNLKEFILMEPNSGHGNTMDLKQFITSFGDIEVYRKIALQHYYK